MEIPSTQWTKQLNLSAPYWQGYRDLLKQLEGETFPTPGQLNSLLPPKTLNGQGQPIRFRADHDIGKVAYEAHIWKTGEVPTRQDNWHDLFNALVWCRFPGLKSAMNAAHIRHLDKAVDGSRGRQRDALTLLDESGVVVLGRDRRLLDQLAGRKWQAVFEGEAFSPGADLRVLVYGHALLEKFLDPYKAMTAQALLVHTGTAWTGEVDSALAAQLLAGRILRSPTDLSPLPLMGIPGWWRAGVQDAAFYDDAGVFRVPAERFSPAHVFEL